MKRNGIFRIGRLLAAVALCVLTSWCCGSDAEAFRALTTRYTKNTNGDVQIVGNAIMTCNNTSGTNFTLCDSARNGSGGTLNNNNFTMIYIDIDSDSTTFSSSSANLNMENGSNVLWAGLYWGGDQTTVDNTRAQCLLQTPSSFGYTSITASQVDSEGANPTRYQSYADVTSLVQAAGNGTYTVANVVSRNSASNTFGGWSLVVVYGNGSLALRNLTVFDGQEVIPQPKTFTVSGFLSPLSGPITTRVGVMAYEGDLGLVGDYLQLNGSTISDATHPSNNFFNSSITDQGVYLAGRNPVYTNNLGYDLSRTNIPNGIVKNGDTSATITLNTASDQYYPSVLTFVTDLYVPIITPNVTKTVAKVAGSAGAAITAGDTLRYTIYMKNTGFDTATNLYLTDPIPAYTTYKPGSLQIISGANTGLKSDAAGDDQAEYDSGGAPKVIFRLGSGADSANGGLLPYNESTSLSFDVTVNGGVPAGTILTNTATISYQGQTLGQTFGASSAAAVIPVMAAPQVSKSFSPNPIIQGGSSTMSITITNPASNPATMTGVTLDDPYPSGLVNTATPNASISCTAGAAAGTLTGGTAGGTSIGMNPGASLPPGGSCTISVNVTSSATENYVNTVTAVSTNAGSSSVSSATLSVGKPAVTLKAFTPAAILSGATSTVSFLIQNPTNMTLTGMAFSDPLTNMLVAGTPNVVNGCGGTVSAAAGAATISLSNGTMAPGASCTITVDVTSNVTGVHPNQASGVVSNQTGPAGIPSNIANLTVIGAPVAVKTFAAPSVRASTPVRLSITVSNPNPTTTLNNVAFTDNYPNTPGVMVNSTPSSSTLTCSSGSTATKVGGVNAGTTLGISAATLLPGGSCTVSSNVQSPTTSATPYSNSTGNITSTNGGTGAPSTAQLIVTSNNVPTATKVFAPATILKGAVSTITITLTNPNATAITGAAFTDSYPFGMVNAATPAAATTCSAATVTAAAGDGALALSGATIPASGSCTVTVSVTSSIAGGLYNSTGPITTANAGTGAAASATLTVMDPPYSTKRFVTNPISAGGTTQLEIIVRNSASNIVALTGVAFTDTYPSGMVNTGTPAPAVTCTVGSSATIAGGASGGNTIGISAGTLAVNGSCTITVNVTAAVAGNYTNSTGPVSSTNGGSGAAASAILSVGQPSIAKAFAPAAITNAQTSTLTITLTNPTGIAMTGAAFTDSYLPGTIINAGAPSTSCGGTATGTIGGTFVGLSNGTIPANSTCTVTVLVSASNSVLNTIPSGGLTVTSGASNANPGSALLNMTPPPGVAKAFSPAVIPQNGTSRLTITLSNSNATAATGVAFTDTYPSGVPTGIVNAATPGLTNSCGGTATASAGNGTLTLSGATIPGNSSCSVAVNVTGAVAGTYVNHSGPVTTTNIGTGSEATANLTIMSPPGFAKAFSPDKIPVNTASTLTITLSNSNPVAISGAAFTDPYPANLINDTPLSAFSTCGGTVTATAGGNSLQLAGGVIPASGSCTINARVTSAIAGLYTNPTAPFNVTTSNAGTTSSVSADLTVLSKPTISKSFTPATINNFQSSALLLTLTNANATSALTNVAVSDSFPAGLYIGSTPVTNTCGGTLTGATQGSAQFTLSGATLPLSSSCTVTIPVTSGQPGVYNNTTSGVTSLETGGPGAVSNTATLTVNANFGAVSGYVYADANHNGNRENGETGTGQTVYVKLATRTGSSCNNPATQFTTPDPTSGAYSFNGITSGDYCVIHSTNTTLTDLNPAFPGGWVALEAASGIRQLTLQSNPMTGQNFGLFNGSRISGRVFIDTGTGAGTANNGLQDGSEGGIAAVAVKATDSSGATTHDSATTSGSGDYILWIPASAGAAQVKVVETNPGGYISTGGSAGTSGGNYDRTSDATSFTNSVGSSYSGINFADVPDSRFQTDNSASALPGTVIFHPHSFTAGSGGSVSFGTSAVASPAMPGWSEVFYRDSNCNGTFDSGEPQITSAIAMSANEQLCLLLKEFIPANAPIGASNLVNTTATFSHTNAVPALSTQLTRNDNTTVGASSGAGLTLTKTVDSATALPGSSLTYTITYGNNSNGPLSNIVIHDTVPAFTSLSAAPPNPCCVNPTTSCLGSGLTPFPNSISACSAATSGDSITWTLTGTLSPGASGQVKFRVTVQP